QLIKAYSTSINDKSEKELRDAAKNLNDAISELKDYPVSLVVSEKFKSILELKKIENSEKSYFTSLQEAEESFKNFKVYLLAFAENKEVEKPIIIIDNKIQEWLSRKLLENSETIKKLGEDSVKKNERILLLDKNIKEFLENQAISDQKEKIASWIRATSEENQLIEKSNKINTHAVATSSSRAHDELLTDSLNSLFKDELNQLGYNNLDVEIVKAKGGKGINPTKLVLKEKNSVDIILSEGEQKAVGLALFIAETKIQKSNCPIILDDPVNSLDHKIAANFANRLLSLDNQLIIFNHNRLFQDAFETAKGSHICKTFDTQCNKQGKHILVYNVSSESKSRKGVLCFYKSNNSKIHIDEAIRELKKSPFTEHTKVAGMLRKAVECIVDEKILNGVIPTKYSNKNNRIPWDNLKNLKNDVTIIEKIRKVHDRVSGGDLHNGTESENNPIDIDEFNKMIDDLESVLNGENQ
nr:hypothetical protein [bacterium]